MYRKGLVALPNVEVLSPLVTRVLGQNPSHMTLQGTNTYLVGKHPDVVLVDTGEKDCKSYNDILLKTVTSSHLNVKSIIITHWHHDHLGGCESVRRLLGEKQNSENNSLCSNTSSLEGCEIPVYKVPDEQDSKIAPGEKMFPLHDKQIVNVSEGCTLRILHTPGHTADSICLHLLEENSLFAGDTILGGSSGKFTDYAQYIASLQRLRDLGVERVYPGHGQVEEGGVVERYISHRQDRERQVLAALRGSEGAVGVERLTERVYEGEAVPSQLVVTAQRIVRLMLEKLREDGTARETEAGLWVAT